MHIAHTVHGQVSKIVSRAVYLCLVHSSRPYILQKQRTPTASERTSKQEKQQ